MSEREQEFSTTGVERVIPIRFVQMRQVGTTPLLVSLERLSRLVGNANVAFQPAGVQFYIKSIESYQMPIFYKARQTGVDVTPVSWSNSLYNELVQIFPNLPVGGSPNMSGDRTLSDFLNLATIDLGKPGEITVLIGQSTSGAFAWYPSQGRLLLSGSGTMNSQEWNFTHELGHYFGLPHPFQGASEYDLYFQSTGLMGALDPSTNQAVTRYDFWDLFYREDTPTSIQFFNSKSSAQVYPQSDLKAQDFNGNCTCPNWDDPTDTCLAPAGCTIRCEASNGVSFDTDTPGAQGMGIKLVGDNPPNNMQRGYNVMGYLHPNNCDQPFSASQVVHIRKSLRHDIRIQNLTSPASGRRNELGQWARSAPQAELDVDGDGKRDIGFYEPPISFATTGKFTIFKSSGGQLIANFGKLGDMPAFADYDGDGKTDVAVWRNNGPNGDDPTSSNAYFIYCASSVNATCSSAAPVSLLYGSRGDVPLPGSKFGGVGPEMSYYRPSESKVYWRQINFGVPFPPLGGSFSIGSGNKEGLGLETLVGYFDGDKKTDIATYDAKTGIFVLARSSQSWTTVQRTFPSSVVVTGTSSAEYDRGRSILMRHAYRKGPICTGRDCSIARKHVAQVWDSHIGEFHTFWNAADSSTMTSCSWGFKDDIPLSGYVDTDSDGFGDFAVYRPNTQDFYIRPATCTGSQSINWPGLSAHKVAVPILVDSDGDGKDEFFIIDGHTKNYNSFSSMNNYDPLVSPAIGTFNVGVRAMLL